jgi:hypothetical protein
VIDRAIGVDEPVVIGHPHWAALFDAAGWSGQIAGRLEIDGELSNMIGCAG